MSEPEVYTFLDCMKYWSTTILWSFYRREYSEKFPVRDLEVYCAHPTLIKPTHYYGQDGRISDTGELSCLSKHHEIPTPAIYMNSVYNSNNTETDTIIDIREKEKEEAVVITFYNYMYDYMYV